MRAAIFDLDGTLVDNMSVHADAWATLSSRHGLAVPRDRFLLEFAGRKNEEIIADLWPGHDESFALRLASEKEALYRELYRPRLAPLAGLLPFLDALAAAGVPLAIASAAPALNRALVLDGLDLRRRFAKVTGAEDAKRGKPFPDPFLEAARRRDVPPEKCLVFEDTTTGIAAATAAGRHSVLVPPPVRGAAI